MAKNDVVVRNAADLERKYNFASLLGLKKNVEITTQGMQKIENELNSMLNALVINLKDVLDSQSEISLWFYSGKPTTSNEPYKSWSNPNDHIGDLYYDINTGYVYQYNGVWEVNTSPDLVEAMAITNAETDTSTDHERKVFFDTPTIPYSNGDWWIKEDGSLFICQISKTSGTYEKDDFIDSSKYTESIATKIGEEIKVLKGTITMITENYAKFTDLATGGSTIISGDNITTGSIQSQNYIKDTSGTKISLEDGIIDAKNFKVDSNGNAIITDGNIELISVSENAKFIIKDSETNGCSWNQSARGIIWNGVNGGKVTFVNSVLQFPYLIFTHKNGSNISISPTEFSMNNAASERTIRILPSGDITCVALNQTSLENKKKNFERFEDGLALITNSDIYKYHLKTQTDNEKKHIGLVIGENYKTPSEIINQNNDGIDLYSMISIAWQGIKEQQEIIEQLKQEIQTLKGGNE